VLAAAARRLRNAWILLASSALLCFSLLGTWAGEILPFDRFAAPFFNERFATGVLVLGSLAYALHASRGWMLEAYQSGRTALTIGWCVANLYALGLLTGETLRAADNGFGGLFQDRGQLAVSLLWTAYATLAFVGGVRRDDALWRRIGLSLFGFTLLKAFLSDLASMAVGYRFLTFGALGIVLVVASTLYQRSSARERQ
jgi:uncharacterized membrane protein